MGDKREKVCYVGEKRNLREDRIWTARKEGKYEFIPCPDYSGRRRFWRKCRLSDDCGNAKVHIGNYGEKYTNCNGKFYACVTCRQKFECEVQAAACYVRHEDSRKLRAKKEAKRH